MRTARETRARTILLIRMLALSGTVPDATVPQRLLFASWREVTRDSDRSDYLTMNSILVTAPN